MGSFFDNPEVKCAAGTGLAVLGFGWGLPFAAEACTEVVQDAVAKVEASTYDTAARLRQEICESQPFSNPLNFLLGVASPITTIAMHYPGLLCESKGSDYLDTLKEGALDVLPFALGSVGGLGLSVWLKVAEREEYRSTLIESLAAGVFSSMALMGAHRTLHHLVAKPMRLNEVQLKAIEAEASKAKPRR